MAKLKLEINSIIDILWEDNIYKSNIQGIAEKGILITVPVNDGIYLTLKKGDEITQIFNNKKGNLFTYNSKILGRYTEKEIPFYRVSKPYDIKRIQRRDYVRVNFIKVINYIKEKDLEMEIKNEDSYENALLVDLSGGGMKIKAKGELALNDVILSNLTYESEKIFVKGKILRAERTENKRYIYGIEFEDINNSTRDKIIKIVFEIMRKQRERI